MTVTEGIGILSMIRGFMGDYETDDYGDEVLVLNDTALNLGLFLVVSSCAYGFVRPFFYHKNSSVNISMNIGAIPTPNGIEPGVSYKFSW